MERREIVLTIRDYIDTLSEDQKYCNGCPELSINKITGARGQVITAFGDGTCKCEEHELIWAYHGINVLRPIECILNGEKYLR